MNLRTNIGVIVPVVVAVVLVVVHLARDDAPMSGGSADQDSRAQADSIDDELTGAELDELKREAWRESRQGGFLDVGEDARQSELGRNMARYGMSPLEFAPDAPGDGGLRVMAAQEHITQQIEEVFAQGGHYSGPRRDLDIGFGKPGSIHSNTTGGTK